MASRLFEDVFDSGTSGCYRQCVCDRHHFDVSDNVWDWDEGELDTLLAGVKRDPDRYFPHDYAIGTLSISGLDIVPDCPCSLADKYEKFIIDNAKQIAQYLNERAENLKKEAENTKVNP